MKQLTVGQHVWVITNEPSIVEVIVKLVGNGEIAFELNGKLETRKMWEVYESEAAANKVYLPMTLILFCREIGKVDNGGTAVYKVGTYKDSGLVRAMALRSRLNPELQYAAAYDDYFMAHCDDLKDINFFNKAAEQRDIVIIQ